MAMPLGSYLSGCPLNVERRPVHGHETASGPDWLPPNQPGPIKRWRGGHDHSLAAPRKVTTGGADSASTFVHAEQSRRPAV